MGTRSRVGVMHGDVVKSVYCHYDGYLSYTGEILQKHYDSPRANALVALGDNSGVKESIEQMNFYNDREQGEADYRVAHTFAEFLEQVEWCGGEYYYIMKDGVWYAGCMYVTQGLKKCGLTRLDDALDSIKEEEAV